MGRARGGEEAYLICTAYCIIMIPDNLAKRSFKSALDRAELSDIRFHDLRHMAATLLLSRGVNPKVVSEMLGHADISITLWVYADVLPHMQLAAVTLMDAVVGAEADSECEVAEAGMADEVSTAATEAPGAEERAAERHAERPVSRRLQSPTVVKAVVKPGKENAQSRIFPDWAGGDGGESNTTIPVPSDPEFKRLPECSWAP